MTINYRFLIVVTVTVLMLAACGEDNAPSSTANKAPQEPAGEVMVTPAETPQAAATPAQEGTESTMASAVSPAKNEITETTASATGEPQAIFQSEVLSNNVVYQEEIYRNWPHPETPQPSPVETEVTPQPSLTNNVVYQEEIYRNWPATAAPQPESTADVSAVVKEKVEPAVTAVEKKIEAATAAVAEKVETAGAGAAGQSKEIVTTGAAETHTINAEARAFNPDIVYIQPGDTLSWINMTSHNSVSIDGLIPEGATPWRGQIGENLKVTLTVEGIYGYVCEPHIGFGMMGVIVVGKPTSTTLEEVKAYAGKNMQGPYRRILGKLNKVSLP